MFVWIVQVPNRLRLPLDLSLQSDDITLEVAVCGWHHVHEDTGYLLVELQQPVDGIHGRMVSDMHEVHGLLVALQPRLDAVKGMVKARHSRV